MGDEEIGRKMGDEEIDLRRVRLRAMGPLSFWSTRQAQERAMHMDAGR
jgi:hypothetical protein